MKGSTKQKYMTLLADEHPDPKDSQWIFAPCHSTKDNGTRVG